MVNSLLSLPVERYSLNEVKLLQSGDAYFSVLLNAIENAQTLIHLQVYIFDLDKTGNLVLDALKRAVQRGVKVFVVVDAYASEQLTLKTVKEWMSYGIYLKRFSPLKNKRGYGLGRRLHHKIVWVDGKVALIGGINIADKYSGYHGHKPWLDFAVEVNGPLLNEIRKVCEEILPRRVIKRIPHRIHKSMQVAANKGIVAGITKNDWLRSQVEISESYRAAIKHAENELTIVASYFLPGNRVRRLLRKATERGVHVKVVLVGVSDVPFVRPAMRYLYDWMFRQNIEIYEWQPSVLHGKLMVVDGRWTTIGSYNLNALSDYGSLELNVEINNDAFATQVNQFLQTEVLPHCTKITSIDFLKHKTIFNQFLRWLSYVGIRMLLRILFGLMQGRKPSHF